MLTLEDREALQQLLRWPGTDTGDAERFALLWPDQYRFRPGGGWYTWAGTHWQPDRIGSIVERICDLSRVMLPAAELLPQVPDAGEKKSPAEKWQAHCLKMQGTQTLYSINKRLSTWPGWAIVDEWDADPYLFSHKGGVANLQTGETLPHSPAMLITRHSSADETNPAPATRWLEFVEQVLPDPDLRAYVQRAVGCSLIGRQHDHVLFMATGTGANGKGTFFRAIAQATGDYYTPIQSTMLIENKNQAHPTDIADLAGKRMAVSSELPANQNLDENKVKELTGGDKQKARFIGKDFFEFWPSHTLWICCNSKPRIRGTDHGIWRRMKVIPFVVKIPPEQEDKQLDQKLAAERDGILRWCLDGAREYMKIGLGSCKAVSEATGDYRASEDTLGQALDELCAWGADCQVAKHILRKNLIDWYSEAGLTGGPPSDVRLAKELPARGITDWRNNKERFWVGIRMRTQFDDVMNVPRGKVDLDEAPL